jgi:hypothetical protein
MKRLEDLQTRSMDMKESLEDSLVYHEFVKDIHDALLWEKEKIALVSSSGKEANRIIQATFLLIQDLPPTFVIWRHCRDPFPRRVSRII